MLCGRKLAELCPAVMWKAKFINDELGCVGEASPNTHTPTSIYVNTYIFTCVYVYAVC